MQGGSDYAERDPRTARNFVEATETAGVDRVIYLGGFGPFEPPAFPPRGRGHSRRGHVRPDHVPSGDHRRRDPLRLSLATLRFDPNPTTQAALKVVDRRPMAFALIQLVLLPFLSAHPILAIAVAGHVLAILVVGTSLALAEG